MLFRSHTVPHGLRCRAIDTVARRPRTAQTAAARWRRFSTRRGDKGLFLPAVVEQWQPGLHAGFPTPGMRLPTGWKVTEDPECVLRRLTSIILAIKRRSVWHGAVSVTYRRRHIEIRGHLPVKRPACIIKTLRVWIDQRFQHGASQALARLIFKHTLKVIPASF